MVACFAILSGDRHEPQWDGMYLSGWANTYDFGPPGRTNVALLAIREMGTNAVQYLVGWMAYEPPAWRKRIAPRLPSKARNWLRSKELRSATALNVLFALGTNAAPAIPSLAKLSRSTDPAVANRAIACLCGIGDLALPALTEALKDPATPHRDRIPVMLSKVQPQSRNTNNVVQLLAAALRDPDPKVSRSAADALWMLAPYTLTNAPAQ